MHDRQLELFHLGPPLQLALIPYRNPLADRFTREFFSDIPTVPGVYRMRGAGSELLYVGKAKNLRVRVRSYARAAPENASSKTLRLLAKIHEIEWDEKPTETAALLAENSLLREHRPPFNVANTLSHTYAFFHLRNDAQGIEIHHGMSPNEAYPDIYGSFKGIGLSLRTFRALLRLLWTESRDHPALAELPPILLNRRRLTTFSVPYSPHLTELERRIAYRRLKQFFNGTASTLLNSFTRLAKRKCLTPFDRAVIEADLETLETFHSNQAKRNYRVKHKTGFADRIIPQNTLDDLFVLAREPGR